MLAARFPGLRLPGTFFFVIRHFGTGILIATAFVHLLPTAFISLGDPCLSDFWTDDYPAMPGAIALAGIFLVVLVEMVFHPCRQTRSAPDASPKCCYPAVDDTMTDPPECRSQMRAAGPLRDTGPLVGRTSSMGRDLTRVATQPPIDTIALTENAVFKDQDVSTADEDNSIFQPSTQMTPALKLRKARLQCVLLEVGILFHSVFIGMALSVSVGSEFVILLIAIAFHRKSPENDQSELDIDHDGSLQKPSKASLSAPASPASIGLKTHGNRG